MNNEKLPSRRDVFRTGVALAGGAMFGSFSWLAGGSAQAAPTRLDGPAPSRKRVLRIAHLTDVHVQPELAAGEGLVACLHHMQSHATKPDLVLNGGDAVMDSLAAARHRAKLQWNLWNDIWKNECDLPLESCIGNHDIWGWAKDRSGAKGDEVDYGKAWSLEALGLDKPYRSFDRAGWRFIVLDGVQPGTDRLYEARLDDEQFDWLKETLDRTDAHTPVCLLSHIPIMCASIVFYCRREDQPNFTVSGSNIHMDALKLRNLFAKHPNVKLCLSGHIHQVDRIDYNGVAYLCNGAVSGGWWKGKHQDTDAGYALVDLYDDGSFEHDYIAYGWKPRK